MQEAQADAASRWPLVGRAEEMARIRQVLVGGGGSVVLSGAAGVGKTRLAREALELPAAAGRKICWITATTATMILPFTAVAQLIPPGTHSQDALGLFQTVADSLANGDATPIVAIDDAHLLDAGSAGLVLHLVNRGVASVVATVRTGEPCPDAVRALWKEQLAHRIDVQALSVEEALKLLEEVLQAPLERDTALRLTTVTGGNPLFLRELVESARANESLRNVHGIWRWDGAVDFPNLRDLVRSRVDQLSAAQRQVVEIVSLGEPLPIQVLTCCVPESDVVATEESGLLAGDETLAVRLVHPLYGEVLRATVGPALRRAHFRRLSEALAASGLAGSTADQLRLATWSLQAGLSVSVEVLVAGSEAAHSVFDDPTAVRLARAAVDAGGGSAAALALAVGLRGDSQPAAAELVLAGLESKITDDAQRLRYLRIRMDNLVLDLGRPQDAIELLGRARGWPGEQSWHDEIDALMCAPLLTEGRNDEVVALGTAVLARERLAERARLTALVPVGLALVELGRPGEALNLADSGVQLAASLAEEFPQHLREVLTIRLSALDLLGQWGEMEVLGNLFYDEAVKRRDQEVLGPAAFLLGMVAGARGRLDAARRWLFEAAGHFEVRDGMGLHVASLGRLVQILAMSGEGAEAERMLGHARAIDEARSSERNRYYELAAGEVWVRAALGDLAGARAAAWQHLEAFTHRPRVQAGLLHEACRLGDHTPELVERLQQVTAATDSPLHAAFSAHAASRSGDELEHVSDSFAALGADLLAAEAAAEAAAAHTVANDQRAARRAAATASRLLANCAGARTPALTALAAPSLTPREREIAHLAADGLSNAAIATRLQLSERTVESHLYRASEKLGVRDRHELASALAPGADASHPPTTMS